MADGRLNGSSKTSGNLRLLGCLEAECFFVCPLFEAVRPEMGHVSGPATCVSNAGVLIGGGSSSRALSNSIQIYCVANPYGFLEKNRARLMLWVSTNVAMGHNLCLHFGKDEHPCTTYFDVHQGFSGF